MKTSYNYTVLFTVLMTLILSFDLSGIECDYHYRRTVTIDHNQVEGNTDLQDFPVLINLSLNDLRSVSNGGKVTHSNGYDIAFTDMEGNPMDHELEYYDPSSGQTVIWVRVPLLPVNQDYTFKMLYGNTSVNSDPSVKSVWDQSYSGVWHIGESSGSYAFDGSYNDNHGTFQFSLPNPVTGKIGNAQSFNGTDDFIELGTTNMPSTNEPMTLQAWAYYSGTPGTENLVLINDKTGAAVQLGFRGGDVSVWMWGGGIITSAPMPGANEWHHYAFTTDGTNHSLYINGVLMGSSTVTLQTGVTSEARINTDQWDENFDGNIDEARISNIPRSGEWIATEFNNQNDPAAFYTIGSEMERNQWTGNNSDWFDVSNWEAGSVPSTSSFVCLGQNTNAIVVDSGNTAEALAVKVDSGAELIINSNATLNISENVINNGTIKIENNGSLVQTEVTNRNSGSGNYVLERNGRTDLFAFNGWSSPIENVWLHDNNGVFNATNPCDIYAFDASAQGWKFAYAEGYTADCLGNQNTFDSSRLISGADGTMHAGRGYFAPGEAAAQRVFEGNAVHNGTYTHTLGTGINPGGNSWTDDYWNLIGNPYPSAININDFLTENTGVLNTASIYVWSDDGSGGSTYSQSDYIVVNSSGSTSPGGSGLDITNGNLASCQGFFVQAASGGGAVTYNNSMRVAGGNDQFRGGDEPETFSRFWLEAASDSSRDEILVAFRSGASRGFDKLYDAPKRINSYNDLILSAQIEGGEEMSIIGEPTVFEADSHEIPLTFRKTNSEKVTFAVNRNELKDEFEEVYLIDHYTGERVNLLETDFVFDAPENTEEEGRFSLMIYKQEQAEEDPASVNEIKDNNNLHIYSRSGEVVIENPEGSSLKVIQLIDMNGRELINQRGDNSPIQLINTSRLSQGIYVVRVLTESGGVEVEKLSISE